MELLTAELRAQLPAHYGQKDTADPIIYAKFFTPDSGWTWYVMEGQQEDDDDYIFYGYVNGHELEQGYFSLVELESVRGPYGLAIERDLYFTPGPWSELKRRENLDDMPETEGDCGCLPC